MINYIALGAAVIYTCCGLFTMHRMKQVERHFDRACGYHDPIPFALYLIGMIAWPSMLPTVVICTRQDRIPWR